MESGYIYILSNPAFKDNLLKIGFTTKDPATRAIQLYTTGVPGDFKIVYAESVDNPKGVEDVIHNNLAELRYNQEREFFVVSAQEAISRVQEVTQREIYKEKLHALKKNTAFRWLCQPDDLIFLIRYDTIIGLLKNQPIIVDFWKCKQDDHILITNIPGEDVIYLGDDKCITLPLKDKIEYKRRKKSKGEIYEIDLVNGGLIQELCDIYRNDIIIWLAKSKQSSNADYYIQSIVDCRANAKLSGFSNPQYMSFCDGIPFDFGYDPSLKEIPNNSRQVFRNALKRINSDILPYRLASNTQTNEVFKLLLELLEMHKNFSQGIYASKNVYSGKNKKRVMEIGERLNQLGGLELMIWVARNIPEDNLRYLEFAWSGIGEWQA